MQEIRFHGRGGQGTVVASIILAKALFSAGYYVQSFPVFGVERRGGTGGSLSEAGHRKNPGRYNVYTPDHVVVQDVKLLESVAVTGGLKAGGWILINAAHSPKTCSFFRFPSSLGGCHRNSHPKPIGYPHPSNYQYRYHRAFARILEKPPMEMICDAIKEDIHTKLSKIFKRPRLPMTVCRYLDW